MFATHRDAIAGLTRDGWERPDEFWFRKLVSGRYIYLELIPRAGGLEPFIHPDE